MRVGILSLLQESNTFVSGSTTLQHFSDDLLLEGESVRTALAGAHHEVGGFLAGLEQQGLSAVPLFAARALPYGAMDAATFSELMSRMFQQIALAGSLDGYLVAPHGATVSSSYSDVDGYWLARLRAEVGPLIPIIGTLDLHANLSPMMIDATDALIAYRSNPHIDQFERGREAAILMSRSLKGEVIPVQHAVFPPFVMNIERQATAESPCLELYHVADTLRERSGVLSISILQGFPYADVAEMGSAVIAVTDQDESLAGAIATELSDAMWSERTQFTATAADIDSCLDDIKPLQSRVCLLDMGDNVGGGSPADSTHLAHALVRRSIPKAFICLFDPAAVSVAGEAGVGAALTLSMGGATDALHGDPLVARVRVEGLYDGQFSEDEARHGGIVNFDQGRSAVVMIESGLTVMLTSKRIVPWSLGQFACCDLDPQDFEVLVAKGVNSPLAAYASLCSHFIRVNTPGVTASDLSGFDYRSRRRPMFPFEPTMWWQA